MQTCLSDTSHTHLLELRSLPHRFMSRMAHFKNNIKKKTDLQTDRIYTLVSYPFVSSSRLPHMIFKKTWGKCFEKETDRVFMEQLGTHLQMVDCQRIVSVANRFTHNTEASPSPETRHYRVNPSSSSSLFSVYFFLFIIITSVLNFAISQLNFWFASFFFIVSESKRIARCLVVFFFLYSEFALKW